MGVVTGRSVGVVARESVSGWTWRGGGSGWRWGGFGVVGVGTGWAIAGAESRSPGLTGVGWCLCTGDSDGHRQRVYSSE